MNFVPFDTTLEPFYSNESDSAIFLKDGKESSFQLALTFDGFPSDISWALIKDEGGSTGINNYNIFLAGGSGYSDSLRGQTVILEKVCVSTNASFTFVIRDSIRDGRCCTMGGGNYLIGIDYGIDRLEGAYFPLEKRRNLVWEKVHRMYRFDVMI
jgi:hypothetical protein